MWVPGNSLEKASKVGSFAAGFRRKWAVEGVLGGEKKVSSSSIPKADPSQPPENAGRKNEITVLKDHTFQGRRLMTWNVSHPPLLQGWAGHRVGNQTLGGHLLPPTSPAAVPWLSNAPVPCRCGSTSLNTWFTPRWQLRQWEDYSSVFSIIMNYYHCLD